MKYIKEPKKYKRIKMTPKILFKNFYLLLIGTKIHHKELTAEWRNWWNIYGIGKDMKTFSKKLEMIIFTETPLLKYLRRKK